MQYTIAQSLRPSKNDWALQIQKDMSDIGLVMSTDEIRKITKDKFQSILSLLNPLVSASFRN